MNTIIKKISAFTVFTFALVLLALPLQAQEKSKENTKPFIEQGTFLTGFSLSFINASREDFNQDFEREFTHISLQVDGLYFFNDRFGIGPLLDYRFTYRDFENLFLPPGTADGDTRDQQFEFGAKGGWYLPAKKIFGGSGNTQFFVDGGISWLQLKFAREGDPEQGADYRFGYRLGTGFLFPVGKRIALQTKLGFQARQREYTIRLQQPGDEVISITETKWVEELALSVGLQVTF